MGICKTCFIYYFFGVFFFVMKVMQKAGSNAELIDQCLKICQVNLILCISKCPLVWWYLIEKVY